MALSEFHPITRRWWAERFGESAEPTPAQRRGWAAIRSGRDTLIAAPTGSGKTLAAFLHGLDSLMREGLERGSLPDEVRILYVSPLKALSADIHHNLAEPRRGMRRIAHAMGLPDVRITAAIRTGDTPQGERARMLRQPPHVLVTTPESLFLLLTAERSRQLLRTVRTVIIDEIHAVIESRRGAHLALSLERLAHVAGDFQRIGLSATQRPIEYVAGFLVGARPGAAPPSSSEGAAFGANGGGGAATGATATAADASASPSNAVPATDVAIVDEGHLREVDLELELPGSPLEAVMSAEVWGEVYDRLAELIRAHRTTLVFVNTRRLAERVTRHLAERLGEDAVATHHGSLSKEVRHDAEARLKEGRLQALVATASLELGIDIGHVDLVCQLGSPRRISALLQRVGRSGHSVGGRPKGRIFPLQRDELVECAALMGEVRRGGLDAIVPRECPLDVLAQQIVAEAAAEDWEEDALFERFRRAWPYRNLERQAFDDVVAMLARGFTTRRARRGALLHRDAVNRRVRGRRASRLVALTAGGAIPELADYRVLLEPEGTFIGTVNEDFAIESMVGDIFQLGNASWQVLRIQPGVVRVADAAGMLPTIPFWFGEAPARSDELSAAVSRLRGGVEERLEAAAGTASVVEWLVREYGVPEAAAEQIVAYLGETKRLLGVVPSQRTLVLERFFDDAGGMQLVLHAPFGARVNRAWGLSLRKKFCRTFNFELQAAATDEAILLSLGPQHSFPLEEVFQYLRPATLRDTLVQALLDAPVFQTRWRWVTNLSLAVPRAVGGRRVPPQIQRMQADDLLAAVFPDAAACLENVVGDREVPDHPLVRQALDDCLTEAMDLPALERIVEDVLAGRLRLVARDLPEPSPLAAQILAARVYEFLDDAPLEERRTQAVQARRATEPGGAADLGALDVEAIERVRGEAWPEAESPDELHDALLSAGFVTSVEGEAAGWAPFLDALARDGRAAIVRVGGVAAEQVIWAATERLSELLAVCPEVQVEPGRSLEAARRLGATPERHDALRELVRGRLEVLGPVTPGALGEPLGLSDDDVVPALLALEAEGVAMRGWITPDLGEQEWCDRRLLARIHRYTLDRLRAEIRPVSLGDFQRFLLEWQRVDPEHRARGVDGLLAVIEQLDGFQAPAAAWERSILPARVADYSPEYLDQLCLTGRVAWGRRRTEPRPAPPAANAVGSPGGRRVSRPYPGRRRKGPRPLRSTPVALFLRTHATHWLGSPSSGTGTGADEAEAGALPKLSAYARLLLEALSRRGASFYFELVAEAGILDTQAEAGLAELVAAGLVTADSFAGLRALLVPSDRRPRRWNGGPRRAAQAPGVDAAGRWSLLPAGVAVARALASSAGQEAHGAGDAGAHAPMSGGAPAHAGIPANGSEAPSGNGRSAGGGNIDVASGNGSGDAILRGPANGRGRDGSRPGAGLPEQTVELWARTLLRRYGVVFRRLLAREAGAPPWRELARVFRRMEARGEIRGGHFVAGVSGEQFALPEAVGKLRAVRRAAPSGGVVALAAADPLNLDGILTTGPRVPVNTRAHVLVEA